MKRSSSFIVVVQIPDFGLAIEHHSASVEEDVVIYWNERDAAHDTRRSVWTTVAYDSFQDQKEFLGQH